MSNNLSGDTTSGGESSGRKTSGRLTVTRIFDIKIRYLKLKPGAQLETLLTVFVKYVPKNLDKRYPKLILICINSLIAYEIKTLVSWKVGILWGLTWPKQ